MNAIRVWASILIFTFAVSSQLLGQELQFSNDNCAITPPDGWLNVSNLYIIRNVPNAIAILRNEEKRSVIILTFDKKNLPPGPLDDHMVAGFEAGIEQSGGGKRISGKFIDVAGMKGYERLGTIQVNGKVASTLTRFVPVKVGYYSIAAVVAGRNVSEVPEIWQSMDSFRFLTPPEPPAVRSAAYQTGYLVGRIMGFIFMVVAVFIVLGIIISRQKTKGNSVRPPPLPSRPPPLPPST